MKPVRNCCVTCICVICCCDTSDFGTTELSKLNEQEIELYRQHLQEQLEIHEAAKAKDGT